MSKRILVTGGCGFIGKSLSVALVQKGFKVVIVDKDVSHVPKNISSAEIIEGDVCEQQTWDRLPQCDYVFHLAAPSSVILFNSDLGACVETTLTGLIKAFEWSRTHGVKKLLYPSSGSIFGKNSLDCSEDTLPDPINAYGKTKIACEYIAKIYGDKVPNLGLRIFAGYGPQEERKGEIASVVTLFIQNILAGASPTIFGNGNQTRDFVYIDNIVEVMLKVMQTEMDGVLNVGSGESVSFNQVVARINQLLHKQIKPTYIHKPKEYLEKTACNPALMRKMLHSEIIPIDLGIKYYLETIEAL